MKKSSSLSRRDFLRLGLLTLGSLAFRPGFSREEPRQSLLTGRVTIDEIDLRSQPDSEHSIIGKRYRDQLLSLYYALEAPKGPAYNPVWYRIWGGYIHSAYIQVVEIRLNGILESVPAHGQLCEVTVPRTPAFTYNRFDGWKQIYSLYYETTHWVTGIAEGPDGKPWYQVTSELDKSLDYLVPAVHMRPIPEAELTPLSPDVPPEEKRIIVSIARQELTAFEGEKAVYTARISSGLPSREPIPQGTRTTRGRFNISSKSASKHMGALSASGAPGSYTLPGVPWTSFFIFEYGVAFHGTYWHNNFGTPMSHGCINMRNPDAKWLFRWITPTWVLPIDERRDWERRGLGTLVIVE